MAAKVKVAHDFESGVRSRVNGTPSFFVNGQKLATYDGTYESLCEAVARYAQGSLVRVREVWSKP